MKVNRRRPRKLKPQKALAPKRNRTVTLRIDQQKQRALELWTSTRGYVSKVCEALNIDRSTFYRWVEKDKEFALALANAEGKLNDWVRDKLIEKIEDSNMQAIKFYLEKRHPDFKEAKQQVNIQSNQFNVDFILDDDI